MPKPILLPPLPVLQKNFLFANGELYRRRTGVMLKAATVKINKKTLVRERIIFKMQHGCDPPILRKWGRNLDPHFPYILKELVSLIRTQPLTGMEIEKRAGMAHGTFYQLVNKKNNVRLMTVINIGEAIGYRLKWEKIL